jgi:hypothetical protein
MAYLVRCAPFHSSPRLEGGGDESMLKIVALSLLMAGTLHAGTIIEEAMKLETRERLAANPPAPKVEAARPRLATKRPVLLLALAQVGAAALDVEMTQHCINKGTCYEANPLMPESRWGQYAVKGGVITSTLFFGLGLRRTEGKWARRLWWVPQAANIGASLYGASTGWRFR